MIRYDTEHLDPERIAFVKSHLGGVKTIADVASGGGKYSVFFAKENHQVTAYDYSTDLLKIVRERARQAGLAGQVKTEKMDLTKLGKKGNKIKEKVDAIFLFDILEHLHDDVGALRKIGKSASKVILINVPTETPEDLQRAGFLFPAYADLDHKRYYNPEKLKRLIKDAGLRLIEIKKINPLMPQGFIPLLLDGSHFMSRFFGFFLAGRGKSVRYRKEYNSLIAAAAPK
ncbi:MAG: class I SAM-dependent methyltransferase [Spirochaetia bacterium]|nr:class I SAM-dependent methyltransferase [Spirochaetia bacterium]